MSLSGLCLLDPDSSACIPDLGVPRTPPPPHLHFVIVTPCPHSVHPSSHSQIAARDEALGMVTENEQKEKKECLRLHLNTFLEEKSRIGDVRIEIIGAFSKSRIESGRAAKSQVRGHSSVAQGRSGSERLALCPQSQVPRERTREKLSGGSRRGGRDCGRAKSE